MGAEEYSSTICKLSGEIHVPGLYPQGRHPPVLIVQEARRRSVRHVEEKHLLPLPGIEPRLLNHPDRYLCTD